MWGAGRRSDPALPPITRPAMVCADFSTPRPAPLMLSGDNVVGLIKDITAAVTVADSTTPYQYIASGTGDDAIVMTDGDNTVVGGSAGTGRIWSGNGNSSITGGAGNETVQAGSGADTFTFMNGLAGGTMVINNFDTTADSIMLSGYAPNSANISTAGGSTMITLSDNTKIELMGVTNLPGSAIV